MNDGSDWNILRTWSVRTLKKIGFFKGDMTQFLFDELTFIMEKLKNGGVQNIQTIIAPSVINVLWTVVTGKRLSEDQSKYV